MRTCSNWVMPQTLSSSTPSERDTCRFFFSIAASFRNYGMPGDGSHFLVFLFDQLLVVFELLAFGVYVRRNE